MRDRADRRTQDLLSWEPPPLVQAFSPTQVRAATRRAAHSKSVATVLRDCDQPREAVAEAMAAYLEEPIGKSALDGYASEAREDHVINVVRLEGLIHATTDIRPLQLMAEPFGYIVVPKRYQHAVSAAMKTEMARELRRRADELDHEQQLDIRAWKGA